MDTLQPSSGRRLVPIVAALLTAAAAVEAADLVLRPQLFGGAPESEVLASSNDDLAHVVFEAVNLPRLAVPAVVILGASAMREALPPPVAMERLLQAGVGRTVPYVALAASGETLGETLTLFDALDVAPGSLAVVHVSTGTVSYSLADADQDVGSPRLPLLPDTALRRLVRTRGEAAPWMPALLRNRVWLASLIEGRMSTGATECIRRLIGLRPGSGCPVPVLLWPWSGAPTGYRYFDYPPYPLQAAAKDSLAILERLEAQMRADRDPSFTAAALSLLIAHAQARGIHLLLVRLPRDPKARIAEVGFEKGFAGAAALARSSGIAYRDLADSADFTSAEFFDLHHLLPVARQRLAGVLVQLVRSNMPTGPQGTHVERQ